MQSTNTARRAFIKNTTSLAVPLLVGTSLPAFALSTGGAGQQLATTTALTTPPSRVRGATVRNVKNYGAFGDGLHDDTAAIQAAINSLPTDGGTVVIPAGTYLIDTGKNVNLRSKMLLQMDPNAILKAKANGLTRYYIIDASGKTDVEVAGGQLIGDRDNHNFAAASGTHEWGHGIYAGSAAARITIRDLRVSKCTGDGICIGGRSNDVVIANVISTQNRRQGLSITNCSNIKVYDSEFSYTQGTAPECGIDIEPDDGYTCNSVLIQNCRFNNNKKYGVNIWNRTTNVTITGSTFEYNGSLGMGTVGINGLTVTNNTFRYNSATGVVYNTNTLNGKHNGNMSYSNYTRLGAKTRTPFTQTGWSSKIERDVLLRNGAQVVIGTNNFK